MQQILKKRLKQAERQFKALPNREEHDYFCVSVYFVQETKHDLKLVMDAVAVKNSGQFEYLDEKDLTFLGSRSVLSEDIQRDLTSILFLINLCSKQYFEDMVVFLPPMLVTYHGLDGKQVLTAKDLIRVIRYSISHNDFSLWNDEVGFRINKKKNP